MIPLNIFNMLIKTCLSFNFTPFSWLFLSQVQRKKKQMSWSGSSSSSQSIMHGFHFLVGWLQGLLSLPNGGSMTRIPAHGDGSNGNISLRSQSLPSVGSESQCLLNKSLRNVNVKVPPRIENETREIELDTDTTGIYTTNSDGLRLRIQRSN